MSIADIIVMTLLAAAAAAAVFFIIRQKRKGKSCPYCCENCPHSGKCFILNSDKK